MTLGSFVAIGAPVRAGERWPRDPRHALLFYEHGLLVTCLAGWDALENQFDAGTVEWLMTVVLSWLPDRIAALHPENRLIPVTSVLEAHFRHSWLLLRDELALTLKDGSRLKFTWVLRIGVVQGGALVRLAYPQEKLVMRRVFGDRLSSD